MASVDSVGSTGCIIGKNGCADMQRIAIGDGLDYRVIWMSCEKKGGQERDVLPIAVPEISAKLNHLTRKSGIAGSCIVIVEADGFPNSNFIRYVMRVQVINRCIHTGKQYPPSHLTVLWSPAIQPLADQGTCTSQFHQISWLCKLASVYCIS